ncbi:histidinol dehydrogenase [Campylobacter hyointestinalis]|uniref:histidinol dehydrogenase n=1 Tax=Campylobacter hyointestinalis TaxID=198 RepID=UPI0007294A5F|nr:histidinol dehydrogenase [Campylobacter hyointestinalis]PPB51513.1 histidinol dehydrogenase [Campylobacter hyointestinalis subsp. hyointestinalis]PPB67118.1 histidinol dehydrogenase [Campylobacter hyointestinalis subsp. hyointestinalis]PPB68095.1 histidinol dehydrogenase [Campylobacter hyointestinalis subsp. hyointestinalis]CUU67985.1 histidinol dehydrogenase [Campylobacter hyointestinalis]CUU75100.1 histidinol dehydrogenase [Campylobacter hyointestinalis subsp. hyointestinalis]
MKILYSNDKNFDIEFDKLINRSNLDMQNVMGIVTNIIEDIKKRGDEALNEQIAKFDHWEVKSNLAITRCEMKNAYDSISDELKESLQVAFERIKRYHEKQLEKTWLSFEDDGSILGQKITAVDRAGLYIPGGKAAYPSSLLMNAVPAIVAGVKDIVVCTPAVGGEVNELLLAAMHLLGINEAYKVGGASAVGAMAYGTKTIKKVDVITGPGNIFVATAKKLVFGDVNIDMIAGPSEIGVIADNSANPYHIAIDLLSQAEHDEIASSFLVTFDADFANKVKDEIYNLLPTLSRQNIARASIENKSAIIVAKDMDESIELMNALAVEHLEIATDNAFDFLPRIKHAGAIFLGHFTPEAIGDYLAGPNHTLPTGGSARFFSPLGVGNFMKKSSIISMNKASIDRLGRDCMNLAKAEGLGAHELSVKVRYEN